MTPVYQKQKPPFVDQEDEDQRLFKLFSFSGNQSSSLLSSFSDVRDQKGCQLEDHRPHDLKVEESLFFGESTDHLVISSPSSNPSPVFCEEKVAVITEKGEEDHSRARDLSGSVKWMSSKKRIILEIANKDAEAEASRNSEKSVMASSSSSNNKSSNIIIRVCSDCKTTTTPLWRSGPAGPKSLCNACGIRQRKARRAMAEAAANNIVVSSNSPSLKQKKEKKTRTTCPVGQHKSKMKLTDPGNGERKLSFNNLALGLSKTSAFGRVFPRDEEEATILLMMLSRGIVHG